MYLTQPGLHKQIWHLRYVFALRTSLLSCAWEREWDLNPYPQGFHSCVHNLRGMNFRFTVLNTYSAISGRAYRHPTIVLGGRRLLLELYLSLPLSKVASLLSKPQGWLRHLGFSICIQGLRVPAASKIIFISRLPLQLRVGKERPSYRNPCFTHRRISFSLPKGDLYLEDRNCAGMMLVWP